MTLTEFLLFRIAEDEAVVQMRQERGEGERDSAMAATYGRTHFVRDPTTPARVLAECNAKRRIVNECMDGLKCDVACGEGHGTNFDNILGLLALPYANHIDYRPEWRPWS